MNRSKYFDYIDRELTALSSRIQTRGRVNLLDFHIHSENFFAGLMNILLHVNLKNMNAICQNTEGLDLIDDVVDAFIRCKIFKNPEGYTYVVT